MALATRTGYAELQDAAVRAAGDPDASVDALRRRSIANLDGQPREELRRAVKTR